MVLTNDEKRHYVKQVRNEIAYWRKQRGLTQGELADLVGASRNSIARLEGGSRTGSFALMTKIAEAPRVTVEELRDGPKAEPQADRQEPEEENVEVETRKNQYRAKLLTITSCFSEESLGALLNVAQAMRDAIDASEKKRFAEQVKLTAMTGTDGKRL